MTRTECHLDPVSSRFGSCKESLHPDDALVGRSPALQEALERLNRVAPIDTTVLLTGETGTGKELMARILHRRSRRAAHPMVTVNLAAIPESLVATELFGHEAGAFTGASQRRIGRFELADRATLFLDEVGELTPDMQVSLLRAVQEGEFERLGGSQTKRVDVRLITATNRDLQTQIAAGVFREDLYFRLNVVRVNIPPLRDRVEDVPLLIAHYVAAYSESHRVPAPELSTAAMDVLLAHRWPGNVRELKNVVERVVLKASGKLVRPCDLPSELIRTVPPPSSARPGGQVAAAHVSAADELATAMLRGGQSFWSVVYPLFMARDLTRADLRKLVQIGLEQTNGNYRMLLQLFNMPEQDYKRFLSFLRKHDCHLPFQQFRAAPVRAQLNPVRLLASGSRA
jgi:DNA-binding NtrC family response regulator